MSHKATFWLSEIELKGITGGAFKVLFHLCNAHNSHRTPDRACFPSQELLMEKTGLSNGGLNNCINQLEAAGILTRLKGTAPETNERRTYYILGCDAEKAQQTPESGVSENDEQTPLLGVANSTFEGNKLHSSGDYPVKEPVKEQVSKKTNKKDLLEEFESLWKSNPNKKGKPPAINAWYRARKKCDFETISRGLIEYFKAWSAEGVDSHWMTTVTAWLDDEAWATGAHMPNRRQTTDDQLNGLMAPTTDNQLDNLFPENGRKMIQ